MDLREVVAAVAAGALWMVDGILPFFVGALRARAIRRALDAVFIVGFLVTTTVAVAASWTAARMLSDLQRAYCLTHPYETRCR